MAQDALVSTDNWLVKYDDSMTTTITHTHTHTHTQDCCSELEALGAGAAHASTKSEKQDQISRDVPRISYKILDKVYGCAMGEYMEQNIREKIVSRVSAIILKA